MAGDDLGSMLDEMLDESAVNLAADEVREREAREAAERRRHAEALQQRVKAEREAARLESIDELTGLTEPDLRKVLAKAAPDHLLVVLATAEDVLRRRILGNLSEDSVRWLRQNLEHMEHVTDAERDDARARVLKVANALLSEGEIAIPEPESVGAEEAPEAPEKELRDLLTDLVKIAEQTGMEALGELAESAGEPLLRDGLQLVVEGRRGEALRTELASIRAKLEARYAQRLRWMEEALIAVGEGETADSFRARLFED